MVPCASRGTRETADWPAQRPSGVAGSRGFQETRSIALEPSTSLFSAASGLSAPPALHSAGTQLTGVLKIRLPCRIEDALGQGAAFCFVPTVDFMNKGDGRGSQGERLGSVKLWFLLRKLFVCPLQTPTRVVMSLTCYNETVQLA